MYVPIYASFSWELTLNVDLHLSVDKVSGCKVEGSIPDWVIRFVISHPSSRTMAPGWAQRHRNESHELFRG